MAKTQIQNVSSAPIGLPTPFRGILLAGARIVVPASVEEVRAGFGGTALRGALELTKMDESAVDDGIFWLGTLLDSGAQAAWAIDPIAGNDNSLGTPAAPLKTMAAFNGRMAGARVSVAATLQLVGDVVDEPLQLPGTRFRPDTSLTVLGTRTQLGTGTISTVTPLGVGGTTFPWRLVTTGMAWDSGHVGAHFVTSTNQTGFIRDVIDGNTVDLAFLCSASFLPQTPVALQPFTVYSLSRALPPSLYMAAASSGTAANIAVHLFDLSLDGNRGADFGGGGVQVGRCNVEVPAQTEWRNASGNIVLVRGCRFNCTGGGPTFGGRYQLTAVLFYSPGTVRTLLVSRGDSSWGTIVLKRVQVLVAAPVIVSTGGMHFDTVSGTRVVQVDRGGSLYCNTSTSILNGASCTSTTGIEVTYGAFLWLGPDPGGAKPSLGIASGCTNDVKLGGGATVLTFTYAQLGAGKQFAFTDVTAPVITQIQGGGFAFAGQVG